MIAPEVFRLIQSFVCVVEEKSLAAAARRLEVTPSAVSKQLSQLEKRLGVRLLQRTTRSQSLTEAGARYYRKCAALLAELEAAEREATTNAPNARGLLRITAPTLLGQAFVAPLLPAFQRLYPEISVELDLEDRLVDLVEESFDVAIRSSTQLPSSTLVAKKLAPHEFIVCASPRYVEEHGLPKKPADLARHQCLLRRASGRGDRWTLTGPEGSTEVPVTGRFFSNSRFAIFHATMAGAGIGVLPRYLVDAQLRSGQLVHVLPSYRLLDRFVYAVYPSRQPLPGKLRAFLDFVSAQARERLGPL